MAQVKQLDEADENVTVVTLIRGKNYTFHWYDDEKGESKGYFTFERAVPQPVPDDLANILEELTEDVEDSDGELITKDVFRVERDAPVRSFLAPKKATRFRLVREDVADQPITKAPPRKPLVGKRPGTFGARKTA